MREVLNDRVIDLYPHGLDRLPSAIQRLRGAGDFRNSELGIHGRNHMELAPVEPSNCSAVLLLAENLVEDLRRHDVRAVDSSRLGTRLGVDRAHLLGYSHRGHPAGDWDRLRAT